MISRNKVTPSMTSVEMKEVQPDTRQTVSAETTKQELPEASVVTTPPLTYVDFMPRCLDIAKAPDQAPRFADFSTVIELANQWLQNYPAYEAWKCETVDRKLTSDDQIDMEGTVYHVSSNGVNKYVRGLRLWLVPSEAGPSRLVQQICYMMAVPEDSDVAILERLGSRSTPPNLHLSQSSSMGHLPSIQVMLDKFNKNLKLKPLLGKILNVETVNMKYLDSAEDGGPLNPELTSWTECGKNSRICVTAIRMYYVIGQSAFESMGIHDEVPVIQQQSTSITHRARFAPFSGVLKRAGWWLKQQQGIRVVHMQTVNVKVDKKSTGEVDMNSGHPGYIEKAYDDAQFTKVFRIFYVSAAKSEIHSYSTLSLSCRLFVPARHSGRSYESLSNNVQRITDWLQQTKVSVFGVETVQYQVHPDSEGTGVQEDRTDMVNNRSIGNYIVSAIRLYFPTEYQEPQSEDVPEEESWNMWGCVLS